ncbi:hypothetical protein [uncultured Algoriphagus sp.]|uniref:hypothetical protein n=1 Tax=uncultured Algoriphagus sp. TaxID=417365 RepID=UPI0030EF53B8
MNTTRNQLFRLLLVSTLLFSCKKDNEEEPLVDPFLVITGVNEIEPALFEVVAKLEESGSLPILEHGFLFSDESILYYSGDQIFQAEGNPGQSFDLSFEKIVEKGKNYYLQAFVRTQIGITYSPVFKFVGGDPPSFKYVRSIFPELLYFGDTVTIVGKYLPNSLDSINVKYDLINADLFNLTDSSFSYTIPTDVPFGGNYREDGFEMKLRINKVHSDLYQDFRFRPAEFPEYTEVSMSEVWKLSGKYLYWIFLSMHAEEETELYGNYTLHNVSHDTISFSPNFVPNTNEPTLGFYIRDSNYVTRHIKIRTSEFAPGQKRLITTPNETITVNAKDFNTFVKGGNQLIIDTPGQVLTYVTQADPESISFSFNLEGPIKSRKFNLYGYNQKVKGKVPLEITYNTPAFPISYVNSSGDELLLDEALAFAYGKEMHIISNTSSYKYDIATKSSSQLGQPHNSFNQPSLFRASLNGKFYYSNEPQFHGLVNYTELFEYNPLTGQSTTVGYLPMSGRVTGSFVEDDRMYYEVSYTEGYDYVQELWAWNGLYNSEWELLKREKLVEPDLYGVGKNFEWQGRNYRFIQYYDAAKDLFLDRLERFNSKTNNWDFMNSFPAKFDVDFKAFSSNEGVYLSNGNEFYLFNPVSLTVKYLGKSNNYDLFPQTLVYVDGKFYYVKQNGNALIYELDLSLLMNP